MLSMKYISSHTHTANEIKAIQPVNVVINRWDLLPELIIKHESMNRTIFVGDSGKAIGPMHIWEITVDDVNRILGYEKYSYNDRLNESKSIEMFHVYQDYWNPEHDIEIALRIWNSGPKGRFEQFAYLTEDYLSKFNI